MTLIASQISCSLNILSRKLEAIAKDETLAGLGPTAAATLKEKDFVDGLIPRSGELVRAYADDKLKTKERTTLANAVRLYARNAKAAAGTVTALGYTNWAETLTDVAEQLGTVVLPKLGDQRALDFDEKKPAAEAPKDDLATKRAAKGKGRKKS